MIDSLRETWSRIRATFVADRLDRELDEELANHREAIVDDLRRQGMPEDDARREAARRIGRLDPLREDHRDERGFPELDLALQSARHAARRLARAPVFTSVVILTLAIGIGANTALFSLVDSLLLRSIPVREPERLVHLQVFGDQHPTRFDKPLAETFQHSTFAAVRAERSIVEDVVGFQRTERPIIEIDGQVEPERAVDIVSSNFFDGLDVRPIIGRASDSTAGYAAVISERWWRTRFGGRLGALGRVVTVDNRTYTIIGVAPPRFHGFDIDRSPDVWISPQAERLLMVARLREGVTPEQAQAALHRILVADVNERWRDEARATLATRVGKGYSGIRDQYQGALIALMGLVTLVLLTTCANVGNLMTLRNAARRRELAMRAALGASRNRLIVYSLAETAMLAAAGCVGGVLLAPVGVSTLLSMLPLAAPPDSLAFNADARLLAFSTATCALGALVFGVVPAWRAAAVDLAGTLQTSHGMTPPRQVRFLGRSLVSAQVALSVVLLIAAGLFVQTLRTLARIETGYGAERIVQIAVDTRYAGYTERDIPALTSLVMERVAATPGVRMVTRTDSKLMQGRSSTTVGLQLPGLPDNWNWDGMEVGPRFFETMGIEIVRGRAFTPADYVARDGRRSTRISPPYIVNEAFAKHFLPGADPLAPSTGIIGIARDAKLFSLKGDVKPVMFMTTHRTDYFPGVLLRASGDPRAMEASLRRTLDAVNPRLLTSITTVSEAGSRGIARERMVAVISGFFSALALLLAAMGMFGVASNTVATRAKELGVRRALGAGQWKIIGASLRETAIAFAVGLFVGSAVAMAVVRALASVIADLLYGIAATDAANLAAAVGVMFVVALAACAIPAIRATRIDPLVSIRQD
jgi:predicted permease